ncbi:sensor histidine kinase [Ramlibacter sp. G-1-2-2]|uniref:Sensor histidine kinase n=1 Tax=Ramlibacter agri TaxID=2728837 RepID=A0A848HGB2_9BURK|nr:ATP-binding protein [Ramlibacter agri]NML48469.1 sensor histidine kinase [Ramlibacter agri]
MRHARKGCWATSVACLAALLLLAPPAAAGGLRITQAQLLTVEGRGFSPPPHAIAPQGPDGAWQPVALPHALPPQLLPEPEGGAARTVVTWYRAQVPAAAAGALAGPAYLYVPRWKTDGQIAVYADGRLVYRSHANLLWNGSNHPLWIALDGATAGPLPATVVLRIQRLHDTGGAISSLWLGDEAAIAWRYRVRDMLQIQLPRMTSAAFLAVGVFAFLVWLRRRQERLYLLFFLMSAASFVRNLHYYVGLERLPVSDAWFGWLTVASLFWLVATAHFFLVRLHGERRRWLDQTVLGVAAAVSLATLPALPSGLPGATLLAPLLYGILLAVSIVAFGFGLASSRRTRSRDALLLAGWSLVSLVLGAYEWALQNNRVDVEGSYLGSYAGIGAFLIFMLIMYRRYMGAMDDVRLANASLEHRLREREAELNASHERLRAVERRQMIADERERLMQDMHDGLGSSLVSALRAARQGRLDAAEVEVLLASCIDDLKLAIDSMETIDTDLLLLLATLRFRLESRLDGTGITLHWDVHEVPPLPWLDPRNALHVLRIVQEAFANALKHAHATEIRLRTDTAAGWVTVSIVDNGRGFDVAQALEAGGRGLGNQQRRAQAVGGDVRYESTPGGSVLVLRLPLVREGAT